MVTDWKEELAKAGSLEDAVFTALGAASACWTNLEGAGTFESTEAKEIGDALVDLVRDYVR